MANNLTTREVIAPGELAPLMTGLVEITKDLEAALQLKVRVRNRNRINTKRKMQVKESTRGNVPPGGDSSVRGLEMARRLNLAPLY